MPFMLTGSLASSLHGEPRATQDVDLVIDPDPPALDRFLEGIDRQRFYVSDDDGARRAFAQRDMFNVIDQVTGWKIDLVIRKDRPFSRVEFGRRKAVAVAGLRLPVATPEDLVLAKLEWASASRSERQPHDVAAIFAVNPHLDRPYLERWAEELGVSEPLHEVAESAG
ncbi:MAG: hypothetical protein GEV08_05900 [Acidimicrobiia bacterium]|nr:hypothetical protein [Acidimicrobiia bacterium]